MASAHRHPRGVMQGRGLSTGRDQRRPGDDPMLALAQSRHLPPQRLSLPRLGVGDRLARHHPLALEHPHHEARRRGHDGSHDPERDLDTLAGGFRFGEHNAGARARPVPEHSGGPFAVVHHDQSHGVQGSPRGRRPYGRPLWDPHRCRCEPVDPTAIGVCELQPQSRRRPVVSQDQGRALAEVHGFRATIESAKQQARRALVPSLVGCQVQLQPPVLRPGERDGPVTGVRCESVRDPRRRGDVAHACDETFRRGHLGVAARGRPPDLMRHRRARGSDEETGGPGDRRAVLHRHELRVVGQFRDGGGPGRSPEDRDALQCVEAGQRRVIRDEAQRDREEIAPTTTPRAAAHGEFPPALRSVDADDPAIDLPVVVIVAVQVF